MIVDGSEGRSASETLILTEWDVDSGCSVPVLLRNTKIDNICSVPQLAKTHQDILRFDITVNVIVCMDVFET